MSGKETNYKRECGQRLRQTRQALGYASGRDFANAVDVPEDRLSTYERGTAMTPPQLVLQLYRRHGISFEWIYAGEPGLMPVALWDKIARGHKIVFRPKLVRTKA